MKRRVQIRAAVADHRQTIIGVGSLGQRGKHNTAGRNAEENQRIDLIGPKNHSEIRPGKSADPVLGDHDLIALRRNGIRDRSKRFPEQPLMLFRGFDGAEECISGTDLRKPGSETYLNMDHRHANRTSMMENTRNPLQKSVFPLSRVNGDNANLAIHAHQSRARRINRECVSHIKFLSAKLPPSEDAGVEQFEIFHG